MLNEFLRWWLAQLADLLPARLQGATGASADALLVETAGADEVLLIQRRRGKDARLGRFALGGDALDRLRATWSGPNAPPIRYRAPPEMLLERQVVLPLAAERELGNVLRYEMDRLTPFPPDQLFWTATTERRDTARGKLILRLSMIPRAPLASLLARLGAAGLGPAALEVAAPDGPRVIGLTGAATATGRRKQGLAALAAGCAALALIAAVLPFAEQARRGAVLQSELAALTPRADHAEALRRRLLSASATKDVIAAAAVDVGDPLAVLAAVTAALPDGSYLTALSLSHRQLDIAGESAAAAGLLAALSAYPILTDVAFSAPVTRDTGGDKDLFSIQSIVAPE